MPGRLSGARGILGHRFVTGVCAFVVALVLLGNQAGALVASDHILISSRNDDVLAAANVSMVAWSQNTKAHPDRYNAYVRPLHGGFTQRLNAFGTTGFAGGFDGTEVIFQQIHAGQSNLRIFDTASGYVQTPREA
ncbi:MAG: hypothetical protein ACJ76P_00600 [Actinomycetota bacterium]